MADDDNQRASDRQTLTTSTFVEIVETLTDNFDVIEVLTTLTARSVDLLDAGAAGVLLADNDGSLRVIGASTERIQLLELFQIQNDEGPSLDCFQSGEIVRHTELQTPSRWPLFSAECARAGFTAVCAVPMRLKSRTIGCLNLFLEQPEGLSDTDINLAQALADVATVVIIQDQATRDAAIREGHLFRALTSRIAIEQAKGMIAERCDVDMDDAFSLLRGHSRNRNVALTSLAESLVAGTTPIDDITTLRRRPQPPHQA